MRGIVESKIGLLDGIKRILAGDLYILTECILNMVLFFSLGFIFTLSTSMKKRRKMAFYQIGLCFLLSIAIECAQYFLRLGSFEVMDVLMNTTGTAIGMGSFWVIKTLERYGFVMEMKKK